MPPTPAIVPLTPSEKRQLHIYSTFIMLVAVVVLTGIFFVMFVIPEDKPPRFIFAIVAPIILLVMAYFSWRLFRFAQKGVKIVAAGKVTGKKIHVGPKSTMTYEMTVGEHVFKVGAKDFDRLRVGDGAEVHFIPETDYLLKISPATLADTSGSEPTVLQTPGYDGQLVALEPEESALIRKKLIEAFLVRTLLFGVLLALPIVFIAIVNPLPWGETGIVPLLISGAAIPYLFLGLPLLACYFWLNKQTVYLYSDWKKGEKKLLKEKVLDRITSNGKIYRYGSPRPNDSEKWYRTGPMYSVQISKLEGNYLDTSGRWIEVESNDFQATSVGDVVTVRLAPLSELPLGIGAKP